MQQPHTETTVVHSGDQQNTGNHKQLSTPDAGQVNRIGGTRAGAENVEPNSPGEEELQTGEQAPGQNR